MAATEPQTPRLYQAELFEEAKRRNIIIRADTGVGKTLVAVLLMRWLGSQPRRKDSTSHSVQIFLVPTRFLVGQQAGVLQHATSLRIKAITGAEQPDLWKASQWTSELHALDVLVCTHQIFLDVLNKGFWSIQNVSLIIFDEAHHTTKNHPYNQIMQVHYHRVKLEDPAARLPRILGLTASPIWSISSLIKANKAVDDLQRNLAAQLYEVRIHHDSLSQHTNRPKEREVYYKVVIEEPYALLQELTAAGVANMVGDPQRFQQGLYSTAVMGPLATLLFARNRLSDSEAVHGSLAARRKPALAALLASLDAQIASSNNQPSENPNCVSEKIHALVKCLEEYKPRMQAGRFAGMIFVEQRRHAHILKQILDKFESVFEGALKSVVFTGHGGRGELRAKEGMGMKREGDAEPDIALPYCREGLDFRACSVVIRFDDILTWKGYIQSRGRARAVDSDYIVMIRKGLEAINKYLAFTGKEQKLQEEVYMRPDDESIDEPETEDTPRLVIELEDGGQSILTYLASPGILSGVCQLLPHDDYTPAPRPRYEYIPDKDGFRCDVEVPSMSELPPDGRIFSGPLMRTKKGAKRGAAYEACRKLLEVGALSKHLLPHRTSLAAQPTDADGRHLIPDVESVAVWSICTSPIGVLTTNGWVHRAVIEGLEGNGTASSFGIVAAEHVVLGRDLVLYDHMDGRELCVRIEKSEEFTWTEGEAISKLARLHKFNQLGVQVSVNRRGYEGEFLLWLAPLVEGSESLEVNWALVDEPVTPFEEADELLSLPFIVSPLRALANRLLSPVELCHYDVTAPPSGLPEAPHMQRFRSKINKERVVSLKHFYSTRQQMTNKMISGPLIYLDSFFKPGDNLRPPENPRLHVTDRVVLPLGACRKSNLPLAFWRLFGVLPSLTRKIHDIKQAKRVKERLGVQEVDDLLVITALTLPVCHVGFNYETLETVGDAFLKLATSVHLYASKPSRGEGLLSILRSKSVDNTFLRGKAIQFGLPPHLLAYHFRVEKFANPYLQDGEALGEGQYRRHFPKPIVSDVVEALLGAAYISGGVASGLQAGTALDLCFGGTKSWRTRPIHMGDEPEGTLTVGPAHAVLEQKLGYTFQNPRLLLQALTHRSANSQYTDCYEREEWLGDAALDMWVINRTYHRFPGVTAEQLTRIRTCVVANASLGFIAVRHLELYKIVLHKASALEQAYRQAIDEIEGFPDAASFYKDPNNPFIAWDPPKILGDALEAVLGAVFVDSHFDLARLFQVMDRVFEGVLSVFVQQTPQDPLSQLLSVCAKRYCKELVFSRSSEDQVDEGTGATGRVCEISFHGQVIGHGAHPSSALVAEQRAAKEAMEKLSQPESWHACGCAAIKRAKDELLQQERVAKRLKILEEQSAADARIKEEMGQADFAAVVKGLADGSVGDSASATSTPPDDMIISSVSDGSLLMTVPSSSDDESL